MIDGNGSPALSNDIEAKIQRQPHLYLRLIQNSLTVAESLRRNYFKNTAEFVRLLRSKARCDGDAFFYTADVTSLDWPNMRDEVVTFIDGDVGEVRIASQVPLLLRVGSYRVKVGERRLNEREQFGYYPIILGDLQGGSKDRKDFIDIVRITAELLGGLSALVRTPDLRLLMFHGPLVYHVGAYAGHTPFTSQDIDLFLHQYTTNPELGRQLKKQFLAEAEVDIYPQMTDRPDEWIECELFEPLAWMAFLYRQLIEEARRRSPPVLVAGVVERTSSREFIETQLLERVFRGLRQKGNRDYFNRVYGRAESLRRGEISDEQMRKVIVEAIYMTHRDWLFRPQVQ